MISRAWYGLMLGCLLVFGGSTPVFAARKHSEPQEFLYQIAQEHIKAGRTDDAIHELRKLLLIAPHHVKAREQLALLEQQDAGTTSSPERLKTQVTYREAFDHGVEAFQRGELSEAARSFEEAYLIQPTDPKLLSWIALVRDEQARRTAMTRSLDEAVKAMTQPPAVEEAAADTAAPRSRSLWDRLSGLARTPLGFDQILTPPEEGRPEILEAGKRAGFQRLYKEGVGWQPIHGFGVSGRTEIFEEPNPIDDYVLEAKILNFNERSQFRRSIVPLFTRSAASRFVLDYEPLPRFTYEYDARTTLHQFQTRYAFKDIDLQTHAFNALYTFPRIPLLGLLTVNPWYKRVLQSSHHDLGSYEHRDELIANFSLQPTPNVEYFFQFDTYDADKTRGLGASKLKLYKGQVRLRFPKLKLFVIPSYEYSDTDFDPSDDEFTKRDIFVDWGMDLTDRLRLSSKEQIVSNELSQPGRIPSNPDAEVFNTFNTFSYELFKDFDVSFGFDHSRAAGMNSYDSVGLRAEVELFKPGILRSKLGYEWLSYYNISDELSLLYWKFFLFQ